MPNWCLVYLCTLSKYRLGVVCFQIARKISTSDAIPYELIYGFECYLVFTAIYVKVEIFLEQIWYGLQIQNCSKSHSSKRLQISWLENLWLEVQISWLEILYLKKSHVKTVIAWISWLKISWLNISSINWFWFQLDLPWIWNLHQPLFSFRSFLCFKWLNKFLT